MLQLPTLGQISKGNEVSIQERYPLAVFIAVSFTVPSVNECIKKIQLIYTMGYYSAINKRKMFSFAAK